MLHAPSAMHPFYRLHPDYHCTVRKAAPMLWMERVFLLMNNSKVFSRVKRDLQPQTAAWANGELSAVHEDKGCVWVWLVGGCSSLRWVVEQHWSS
jgi:hypothetical protein